MDWKLYSGEQGLWVDLIRQKYLRSKDLLTDVHHPGSQFWNALQRIKGVLRLGARHLVGNDTSTMFWLDWWTGTTPFRACFPSLFAIAADPEVSVAHSLRGGEWVIPFHRTVGRGERLEWEEMRHMLLGTNLSSRPDELTWTLERSGKFSVNSLYRKLCQGIVRKHYSELWRVAIPLKISVPVAVSA
jgi:hypothetical protein